MTAQMSDVVTYRGEEYSIAGINGEGLFAPEEHGITPIGRCSACWRGFVCGYRVSDQTLWLDNLSVNLALPAPVLFGVTPSEHSLYENLAHKVPYTGGLLLGRDFIEKLYVHMGFHPAWKFREVHELIFENGTLMRESDRSKEVAQLREDISHVALEPGHEARRDEITQWIERCFSQKYSW